MGQDTSLCQGETLLLDGTTPNASYLWQDNSTNPTFTVTQQGVFWVEVTVNNCSNTDTVNIGYITIPSIDLGQDTALCQGDTLLLDATSLNATYLWHDNSTNPTFNITQQGTYWVQVLVNNCSNSDTITLNYYPNPTVNLGTDTTICEGETFIIDASTLNATYLWHDNSTNSSFTVTDGGIHWVEVITNCQTISDSVSIISENCNCTLYMPNAFSPNNDGINDMFAPISNCKFNEYVFMIFNRWGEKIYVTKNATDVWEGTYNGQVLQPDVYVYKVTYQFKNENSITKNGSVTILR